MENLDLAKTSGLPLGLEESKLVFREGVEEVAPDVRTHERMLSVLKEPEEEAPSEFYYMYRNVCLENDRQKISENGLRYDITILPPFKVGSEFNKTFGHFHPKVPGMQSHYPEVYEVL